jgi:hypothetical protein
MADTGLGPEEFSQAQWYRFGDFVRRAMHAAVDDIEPQDDGLEQILAETGPQKILAEHPVAPAPRRRWWIRRGTRLGGPGSGTSRP